MLHCSTVAGCRSCLPAYILCNAATQGSPPMAKAATVSFPTELKLPKLDLDALFTTQQANLATVREAQMVLTGAVQAITEVQYGYLDQALNEAKATLARRELPKA